MIVLQSMDRFDSIAVLDADTGQISWFSRSEASTLTLGPTQGAIAELQQRTLCLYRRVGSLHFRVDDEDFELTEETSVRLARVNETTNTITISRREDLHFSWTYQRPVIDPPLEDDPTPFVEEEHFDFCLFVYNVANNPGRKARIYTETWSRKMAIDQEELHPTRRLIVDPQVIRQRILGGDAVFAQRVLLTILIKGSEQERSHILAAIDSEHLFTDVFRLLFLWVSQDLSSVGQVDQAALYERMEAYVRDHWTSEADPSYDASQYSAEQVMRGYLSPIDHVRAIDMPDAETIDHAIATLQRFHSWRSGLQPGADRCEGIASPVA